MLNWFLNKIFNDFQIRTNIYKILKYYLKSQGKLRFENQAKNYGILGWEICEFIKKSLIPFSKIIE